MRSDHFIEELNPNVAYVYDGTRFYYRSGNIYAVTFESVFKILEARNNLARLSPIAGARLKFVLENKTKGAIPILAYPNQPESFKGAKAIWQWKSPNLSFQFGPETYHGAFIRIWAMDNLNYISYVLGHEAAHHLAFLLTGNIDTDLFSTPKNAELFFNAYAEDLKPAPQIIRNNADEEALQYLFEHPWEYLERRVRNHIGENQESYGYKISGRLIDELLEESRLLLDRDGFDQKIVPHLSENLVKINSRITESLARHIAQDALIEFRAELYSNFATADLVSPHSVWRYASESTAAIDRINQAYFASLPASRRLLITSGSEKFSLYHSEPSVRGNVPLGISSDNAMGHIGGEQTNQLTFYKSEQEYPNSKSIKKVTPFTIGGKSYSYRIAGILYADSPEAANKGYYALRAMPERVRKLLVSYAKQGALLLFQKTRIFDEAAKFLGVWNFSLDVRDALRSEGIRIDGYNPASAKVFDGLIVGVGTGQNTFSEIQSVLAHEGDGHHYWFDVNYQKVFALGYDIDRLEKSINPGELADPFFLRRQMLDGVPIYRSQLDVYIQELGRYVLANNLHSAFEIQKIGSDLLPGPARLIFQKPVEQFCKQLVNRLERLSKYYNLKAIEVEVATLDYNAAVTRVARVARSKEEAKAAINQAELSLYGGQRFVLQDLIKRFKEIYPELSYRQIRMEISDAAFSARAELAAYFRQAEYLYPREVLQLAPGSAELLKRVAAAQLSVESSNRLRFNAGKPLGNQHPHAGLPFAFSQGPSVSNPRNLPVPFQYSEVIDFKKYPLVINGQVFDGRVRVRYTLPSNGKPVLTGFDVIKDRMPFLRSSQFWMTAGGSVLVGLGMWAHIAEGGRRRPDLPVVTRAADAVSIMLIQGSIYRALGPVGIPVAVLSILGGLPDQKKLSDNVWKKFKVGDFRTNLSEEEIVNASLGHDNPALAFLSKKQIENLTPSDLFALNQNLEGAGLQKIGQGINKVFSAVAEMIFSIRDRITLRDPERERVNVSPAENEVFVFDSINAKGMVVIPSSGNWQYFMFNRSGLSPRFYFSGPGLSDMSSVIGLGSIRETHARSFNDSLPAFSTMSSVMKQERVKEVLSAKPFNYLPPKFEGIIPKNLRFEFSANPTTVVQTNVQLGGPASNNSPVVTLLVGGTNIVEQWVNKKIEGAGAKREKKHAQNALNKIPGLLSNLNNSLSSLSATKIDVTAADGFNQVQEAKKHLKAAEGQISENSEDNLCHYTDHKHRNAINAWAPMDPKPREKYLTELKNIHDKCKNSLKNQLANINKELDGAGYDWILNAQMADAQHLENLTANFSGMTSEAMNAETDLFLQRSNDRRAKLDSLGTLRGGVEFSTLRKDIESSITAAQEYAIRFQYQEARNELEKVFEKLNSDEVVDRAVEEFIKKSRNSLDKIDQLKALKDNPDFIKFKHYVESSIVSVQEHAVLFKSLNFAYLEYRRMDQHAQLAGTGLHMVRSGRTIVKTMLGQKVHEQGLVDGLFDIADLVSTPLGRAVLLPYFVDSPVSGLLRKGLVKEMTMMDWGSSVMSFFTVVGYYLSNDEKSLSPSSVIFNLSKIGANVYALNLSPSNMVSPVLGVVSAGYDLLFSLFPTTKYIPRELRDSDFKFGLRRVGDIMSSPEVRGSLTIASEMVSLNMGALELIEVLAPEALGIAKTANPYLIAAELLFSLVYFGYKGYQIYWKFKLHDFIYEASVETSQKNYERALSCLEGAFAIRDFGPAEDTETITNQFLYNFAMLAEKIRKDDLPLSEKLQKIDAVIARVGTLIGQTNLLKLFSLRLDLYLECVQLIFENKKCHYENLDQESLTIVDQYLNSAESDVTQIKLRQDADHVLTSAAQNHYFMGIICFCKHDLSGAREHFIAAKEGFLNNLNDNSADSAGKIKSIDRMVSDIDFEKTQISYQACKKEYNIKSSRLDREFSRMEDEIHRLLREINLGSTSEEDEFSQDEKFSFN